MKYSLILNVSLSDGGGWSKRKVSFLVSSQSIIKRLSPNFATIIIQLFGNNPENFPKLHLTLGLTDNEI